MSYHISWTLAKMIILMKIKLKTDSNTDERSQIGWTVFDILAFPMAIIESTLHTLALWWTSTNTIQEEIVTILASHY